MLQGCLGCLGVLVLFGAAAYIGGPLMVIFLIVVFTLIELGNRYDKKKAEKAAQEASAPTPEAAHE
jgi:hypothetical protein